MRSQPVSRPYDNRSRRAAARATRRRVIDAAHGLLLERGYAATTITEVAGRAEVSPETIYKVFGTKASLLKHVYDTVLAGDDEPVPLAERPATLALRAETDRARIAVRYAAIAGDLAGRLGPLLAVVLGARGTDEELDILVRTIEQERLVGATMFVGHLERHGHLRPGLDVERARDVIWTLIAPETFLLLTAGRGWSVDDYEHWLADTIATTVLAPRGRTPSDASAHRPSAAGSV